MSPIYLTGGNQRFDLGVGRPGSRTNILLSLGGKETVLKIDDNTSRPGKIYLNKNSANTKLTLGTPDWRAQEFFVGIGHDETLILLNPDFYRGDVTIGGNGPSGNITIDEIPAQRRRLRMLSEMDDFMLSELDEWTLRGLDIVVEDSI